MNDRITPAVLARPRKPIVTAKVDDGQPAWVSRTPIGEQDERPMFKHDCETADLPNPCCVYLGTRLITSSKGPARYADLYYSKTERIVLARWSNKGEDYYTGSRASKRVPGIDAALKIAARKGFEVLD